MEPIPEGMVVDHLMHPPRYENKFDNRKENLAIKTTQQNSMNIYRRFDNKTGVAGVTYRNGKWIARIGYQNKRYHLGSFNTFEEAVKVRKEAEEELWNEFSFKNCLEKRLNQINKKENKS